MRLLRLSFLILSATLPSILATAQTATGIYPYGTFDSLIGGTINVGNLNMNLNIPVINKPGRGGLNFAYSLSYDSSIWSPANSTGTAVWTPSPTWGWNYNTLPLLGTLSYQVHNLRCFDPDTRSFITYRQWWKFVYVDSAGVKHQFPTASYTFPVDGCNFDNDDGINNVGTANDSSGLQVDPYNGTITYRNGAVIMPPVNVGSAAGTYTDRNGNQITTSGSSFVDTLGTTALSLSGGSPSNLVFTYKDTSGTSQTVTVSYASHTVQTAFGCSGISEYGPSTQYLVDRVTFPDTTYYQFSYEATPGASSNVTGRVASVRLPAGGTVSYGYSSTNCRDGSTLVLTRTTSDSLSPRTYTRSSVTGTTSITDAESSSGNHTLYNFVLSSAVNNQMYATHRKVYNGAVTGTPVLEDKTCYNGATSSCDTTVPTFPLSEISVSSTADGLQTDGTDTNFDTYGQLNNIVQYDYGSGSTRGGVLNTTYYVMNGTSGLLYSLDVVDASGHNLSTHVFNYDEATPAATSGLPNHTSAPGSSRYNLTSEQFNVPFGVLTKAYYTYDDAGTLLTTRQDTTNTTTITYDTGTDTFPTRIDYPSTMVGTSSVAHYVQPTYDLNTGLLTSFKDQNHGTPTTYHYDTMLRLYETDYPDGGKTSVTYDTTATSPYVQTSVLHAGSTSISSTSYYDGYGRTSEVDNEDSPSDALVDTFYNADGLPYKVSNPYRSGETPVYTTSSYDALGRVYGVTDADGSTQSNTYSGNSMLAKDEALKQREFVYDGAGRLAKVFEPDSSNSLTLETDYLYYQNFTTSAPYTYQTIAQQKGGTTTSGLWRTRTFTYDLLGRLVWKNEPESGRTDYSYLSSGSSCSGSPSQPCSRTDANGTITTYSYDALNRLTGKTYSGSTSAVSYYYDQSTYNGITTIQNGIGQRTGMSDGSGSTAWSFDPMGRPTLISKTISGTNLPSSDTFNLDGTINTLTDYSGTTFTYGYDAGGSQTSVYDGSGNTYASGITHNASGQLTGMTNQLTSGSTQYARVYQYNTRLQPSTIQATAGGTQIQSLSYTYPASPYNNGNISSIANGMDTSHGRDQAFQYDSLNRLTQGSDGSHWGQLYTYDNWGNLYATAQLPGLGGKNWTLLPPGNNNQLGNQIYDSAGQMTQDEHGNIYHYDAEGRILSGGSGSYLYDGDGYRVSKTASSTATLYWPSPVVGVSDESNGSGTSFGRQVFVAGLRVWSEPVGGSGIFLFQDHLGSVRITGTSGGAVKDDIDYLPFGYLYANYGTASGNHYRFTDNESDDPETSSEYAIYRNLNPSMGRFNRSDPYDGSYDVSNPQSLNRYTSVLNNPMRFTDPTGTTCYAPDDPTNPNSPWHTIPASTDGASCAKNGGGAIWVVDVSVVNVNSNNNAIPTTYFEVPYVIYGSGGGANGTAPNKPNCSPIGSLPSSGGFSYGGNADIGGGPNAGFTSTAGGGTGFFYDSAASSLGAFASGGAAGYFGPSYIGAPSQQGQPFSFGAYAGAGPSVWFSNAHTAQQLAGPFTTYNFNAGGGLLKGLSLQLSVGGGIWQFSVGLPIEYTGASTPSLAISKLTTTTVATHGGCKS